MAVKLYCMTFYLWLQVTLYLSKQVRCITPRVNPNVDYRIEMIMMSQCRFTDCNKCPLGEDVIMGEAMRVQGRGNLCLFLSILLGSEKCSKKPSLLNSGNSNTTTTKNLGWNCNFPQVSILRGSLTALNAELHASQIS